MVAPHLRQHHRVIDDDRHILISVSLALEAEGYRIISYPARSDGLNLKPSSAEEPSHQTTTTAEHASTMKVARGNLIRFSLQMTSISERARKVSAQSLAVSSPTKGDNGTDLRPVPGISMPIKWTKWNLVDAVEKTDFRSVVLVFLIDGGWVRNPASIAVQRERSKKWNR